MRRRPRRLSIEEGVPVIASEGDDDDGGGGVDFATPVGESVISPFVL